MLARHTTRLLLPLGVAALAGSLLVGPVAAQGQPESARLVENLPTDATGAPPTLLADDAWLTRSDDRLVFEIRMTTPEPGTYKYPDSVSPEQQAAPEVFTAWAFVFNYPEHCASATFPTCGADDFSVDAKSGVYGVAGHVTSIDHEGGAFILDRGTDGSMILRGEIEIGQPQDPTLPPEAVTYPLENPLGAEVHLAIAPHGQLDPSLIASELYAPAGSPPCECWWVAFFEAPSDA